MYSLLTALKRTVSGLLLFGAVWRLLQPEGAFSFYLDLLAPFLIFLLPLALLLRDLPFTLAILLFCAQPLLRPALLPAGPERSSPAGETRLTITTWNALGLNEQDLRSLAFIKSFETDIVAVQELSPGLSALLSEKLRKQYPYQILVPGEGSSGRRVLMGMGVLSRFPLHELEAVPASGIGVPQAVQVRVGADSFRLLNVHTLPPHVSSDDGSGSTSRAETFRVRREGIRLFRKFAESGRALLVGDFNLTPFSAEYSSLLTETVGARLYDSATGVNRFLAPTWSDVSSDSPRLFRIDYIFHTGELRAERFEVLSSGGLSDHAAVRVELSFAPTKP